MISRRNVSHVGHVASGSYATGAVRVIRSSGLCGASWPVLRSTVPLRQLSCQGFVSRSDGLNATRSSLLASETIDLRRASDSDVRAQRANSLRAWLSRALPASVYRCATVSIARRIASPVPSFAQYLPFQTYQECHLWT